jgi:hypothetical protein
VVKAFLVIEKGEILLKLQNGFPETVQLKEVVVTADKKRASLLERPEELAPADTRYLELTKKLRGWFDVRSPGIQEKLIRVRLGVEPRPQGQPEKFTFRVIFKDGIFTESNSS